MYSTSDINTTAFLALQLQTSPGIQWNVEADKAFFIFNISSNEAENLINNFFNGARVDAYAFCNVQQRLKSQIYSSKSIKKVYEANNTLPLK